MKARYKQRILKEKRENKWKERENGRLTEKFREYAGRWEVIGKWRKKKERK
jgi:hypothetical protein